MVDNSGTTKIYRYVFALAALIISVVYAILFLAEIMPYGLEYIGLLFLLSGVTLVSAIFIVFDRPHYTWQLVIKFSVILTVVVALFLFVAIVFFGIGRV